MVFSNFGAPLYEGFENSINMKNEDGGEDTFKYEFVELKEVKDYEGDLKVKVTLPNEGDGEGDGEGEGDDDIVMCYIIKPQNRTLANYKKTFDDLNKDDEIDKEDFLSNLKVDESEFEKIQEFLANNDAKESLEIPIKYDSLTIKYILEQDSGKECDEESNATTQAITQATKKNDSQDRFKDYDKESDDSVDEEEEEEDEPEEDDSTEPFVGNRIEGFNGSGNRNAVTHNFNVKMLLKSLLFACLFYLLAHDDTRNVLLKVVKIEKGYYLYLATILFFIIYLILNILV
jgi:hypothetical protein